MSTFIRTTTKNLSDLRRRAGADWLIQWQLTRSSRPSVQYLLNCQQRWLYCTFGKGKAFKFEEANVVFLTKDWVFVDFLPLPRIVFPVVGLDPGSSSKRFETFPKGFQTITSSLQYMSSLSHFEMIKDLSFFGNPVWRRSDPRREELAKFEFQFSAELFSCAELMQWFCSAWVKTQTVAVKFSSQNIQSQNHSCLWQTTRFDRVRTVQNCNWCSPAKLVLLLLPKNSWKTSYHARFQFSKDDDSLWKLWHPPLKMYARETWAGLPRRTKKSAAPKFDAIRNE